MMKYELKNKKLSLTPETKGDRVTLKSLAASLEKEQLAYGSVSVNNKLSMLVLPMVESN